jgi:class 3 adenylate cyclase
MAGEAHTFLFMDLVGFTALTAERGDDRAADVAQHLYGHVRGLLEEYCAEEIKTIGDAMMLRCDDPQLAIELGVRIVDGLSASDALPALRVGVHSGTAVCRDGDWYGSAVNVASRLCSAAGGAEVLVSEDACRAAGELEAVALGERRLHWLKNVPKPIAARAATADSRRSLRQTERRLKARLTTKLRGSPGCPPATEVAI